MPKLAYFSLGIRILIDARMENGVIDSQACILTGKHGIYQLIAGTSESKLYRAVRCITNLPQTFYALIILATDTTPC